MISIITVFLFFVAAGCWGMISHYTFHNNVKNPYSFWGKESWTRKYKWEFRDDLFGDKQKFRLEFAPENWYYKLFKIKYKERFPLSATALVFVTDGYHLVQWVATKALIFAVADSWQSFLILWATWTIGFNVIYTWKE